jgi:hypothetical protein
MYEVVFWGGGREVGVTTFGGSNCGPTERHLLLMAIAFHLKVAFRSLTAVQSERYHAGRDWCEQGA